jgi:hypothetical protein
MALVPFWQLPAFWRWHGGAWLAFAVGTWLQRGGTGLADGTALLRTTLWALTGAAVSAALAPAVARLPDPRLRPGAVAARGLALALSGAGPWFVLHWVTSDLGPVAAARAGFVARGLATHVWLLLAWGTVVLGVEALRRAGAAERARLAAERLAVEARHRVLVAQVNPHFLFNTLNSVRALAAEDPERTRTMVTRLAEFLRAALDADPLTPAPLGRELDTAASYLAIEQVRFGDRLRATVEATAEARAATLPGFLLHPIVENAVTHGRGTPLVIAVRAWCADGRLAVEVANGGAIHGGIGGAIGGRAPGAGAASHEEPRPRIGVANVRERLALLYGDDASLTLVQDGVTVRARLTLPLATPARGARPAGGPCREATT